MGEAVRDWAPGPALSAGGAPQAGARSRVPQRPVCVLGEGTGVRARGGRTRRPRPPTRTPRLPGAPRPAAPGEAQRRRRPRRAAPSRPARAPRSGVSGPRAPPRGHGASCTREAGLGGAALSPGLLRSWVSTRARATCHPGHPVSVSQVKVKVRPGAGAHFCPLTFIFISQGLAALPGLSGPF